MDKLVLLVAIIIGMGSNTAAQSNSITDLGMEETDMPNGLVVGEHAPEISGTTPESELIELTGLLEQGPTVIFFYRGYWSPECVQHLTAFQDSFHMLTELGLQILAITPESHDSIDKMKQKTQAQFDIISDPGGEIMRAFNVDFKVTSAYIQRTKNESEIDIASNNNSEEAFLPVTATYIISHEQEIFWRHFNVDFTRRAGVAAILRAVKPKY